MKSAMEIKAGYLADSSGGTVEFACGSREAVVVSIEYDSRRARKGTLFVAVEGFESDGHNFVKSALDAGASVIAVSKNRFSEFSHLAENGVTILVSENMRSALSSLSSSFYGNPSGEMLVIGITGTNGKTSSTYMLESILKSAGRVPAVMGTVNYRWKGNIVSAPNTTPESKEIHSLLREMRNDGVDSLVMEVSSHALKLCRADHIDFDCVIFTNLTRDHLDFHGDFEDYFESKKKLFALLERSGKKKRCAAVNIDDEYGRAIYSERKNYSYPVSGFGLSTEADFRPSMSSIRNRINGLSYHLESPVQEEISLKLAGRFHVYNSLGAVAAAVCCGFSYDNIRYGLASLETVPGRFDVLYSPANFAVVVDYAHTGDALLKLLQSVNEIDHSRVITLFGCGGDRDRTKRPIMGSIAAENSDHVIVTSDNPRTEDPEAIIKEILAGIKGGSFEVISDRESAIAKAISMAAENDIVVIAGKGHEDYQIVGKEKHHFDDREIAAKYMAAVK